MRFDIILKFSLCMLFCLSYAQAGISVRGQVLEKGTKIPLSNINVFILPYKLKAVTNSLGEFIFPDVPEGEFEFVINKVGYLRLTDKNKTSENKVTLYLEKEVYDVFETVVTARGAKKDVTKKTLKQKDFMKAPGAIEDPVKAVQNLAGVANQNFSSQIVVQGSEPDDTIYTLDGHEIPLVFHFAGLNSVLNPKTIEDVEFLAAGYGPEYGRALGGVINLRTNDPSSTRWRGEGFIDITKLGVMSEGPINEKSSLAASARVSYFGKIIEKAAEEMDDFAVTAAPEFQDYYFKYQHKPSDSEEFSFIGLSSKDSLALILREGDNPNFEGDLSTETTFYRLLPRYKKKVNDRLSYDLSVAFGQDNLEFNIADQFFDLTIDTSSQRAELKYIYNDKLQGFYGLDSQFRKFNLDIKLPNTSSDGGVTNTGGAQSTFANLEGQYWESAIYLRHLYKYSSKWTLSPNLRVENFSDINKSYLSPRVSTTYEVRSDFLISFALGRYYQVPQNGQTSEEFGNPDIEAERSDHYFINFYKDFREGASNGLYFDLGFFYKKLEDLVVSTTETRDDGTPLRNVNEGTGHITGAQLQGNYKKSEFTFLLSYTYMRSRRSDLVNSDYPSRFDQTHNLNFISVYEKTRWSLSTRLRYVTGSPYTPIVGSIYNSDADIFVPTRGEFFSRRYEDFFQLDIRYDRKFVYNTWILSVYLDIQNITNSNNGQALSYNYDYSDSTPAAGLPILPVFGLRGEF